MNSLKQALGQMAPSCSGTDQAFVRVVRMTFRTDCIDRFVLLFEENKGRIAGHKGCRFVYLLPLFWRVVFVRRIVNCLK